MSDPGRPRGPRTRAQTRKQNQSNSFLSGLFSSFFVTTVSSSSEDDEAEQAWDGNPNHSPTGRKGGANNSSTADDNLDPTGDQTPGTVTVDLSGKARANPDGTHAVESTNVSAGSSLATATDEALLPGATSTPIGTTAPLTGATSPEPPKLLAQGLSVDFFPPSGPSLKSPGDIDTTSLLTTPAAVSNNPTGSTTSLNQASPPTRVIGAGASTEQNVPPENLGELQTSIFHNENVFYDAHDERLEHETVPDTSSSTPVRHKPFSFDSGQSDNAADRENAREGERVHKPNNDKRELQYYKAQAQKAKAALAEERRTSDALRRERQQKDDRLHGQTTSDVSIPSPPTSKSLLFQSTSFVSQQQHPADSSTLFGPIHTRLSPTIAAAEDAADLNASNFFARKGGCPNETYNSQKRRSSTPSENCDDVPFKARQLPSTFHGKLNTNTCTSAMYRRWLPTAQLALASLGVLVALQKPETASPEVCAHCVSCILLMLAADCIVDFEDHIGSYDAVSLWYAIRGTIHQYTAADLDTLKSSFYNTTIPQTGLLRNRIVDYFDDMSSQIRLIRSLDATWQPDVGMLRRRIVAQTPEELDAYVPFIHQYQSLHELRSYLESSASSTDTINATRSARAPAMQSPAVPSTTDRKCWKCQKPGHIGRDCKETAKPRSCLHCGDCDHKTLTCPILTACSGTDDCPINRHAGHKVKDCNGLRKAGFTFSKKITATSNTVTTPEQTPTDAATTPTVPATASTAPDHIEGTVAASFVPGHQNTLQVGNHRYQRLGSATFAPVNALAAIAMAGVMTLSGATALTTVGRDITFSAQSIQVGTHPMMHVNVACNVVGNTTVSDQQTVTSNNTWVPPTSSTHPIFHSSTELAPATAEIASATICMLSADAFRRAAKCLDSGCSHHLFSEQYVADNPTLFTKALPSDTAAMPTRVGNWQGTAVDIERYVWYTDIWPTDRGNRTIRLGPCIVQSGATMNLLSEQLIVEQLQVSTIFRPDGKGKYLEFKDGARIYLTHHQHLQYLPTHDNGTVSAVSHSDAIDDFQDMPTLAGDSDDDEETTAGDSADKAVLQPPPYLPEGQYHCDQAQHHIDPPPFPHTDYNMSTNAAPPRSVDSTPITPEDRETAWKYQNLFLRNRHTVHDGSGGETTPSDDLLRTCRLAHDADLDEKCESEHTAWVSKDWRKFAACFGFRDKTKLLKVAKAAGYKVSARDMRYCEQGLTGNARLQRDPPSTGRTQYKVGDCISQDPVPLPCKGYGNNTYAFFTVDHGTGKVEIFPAKDKSSKSAIDGITEYIRNSTAYRGLAQMMPKVFKSDSESIYTSTYFVAWLRSWRTGSKMSAPYHHRQNGFIESRIGHIYKSAVAMVHNAVDFAKLSNGRNIEEFFSYALEHSAMIDSFLEPSNVADLCPFTKDTGEAPPLYLLKDFWGAPVMVAIAKENRTTKTSIRGRPGFLLGISKHHWRSYRIYIPAVDKVIVSSDVYFSQTAPRSDWLPVLDDDDNLTEEYTLDNLIQDTAGTRPPFGDAPPAVPVTSSGSESVPTPVDRAPISQSPQLYGPAPNKFPNMDEDLKSAGFSKSKINETAKRTKSTKANVPLTVGQSVAVDYGNGNFYNGIIDAITTKSIRVSFPDEGQHGTFTDISTKDQRLFHVIRPSENSDNVDVMINTTLPDGSTYSLFTKEVHNNSAPVLEPLQPKQFPSHANVTLSDEVLQEEVIIPIPQPVLSHTQLQTAGLVMRGARFAMTAVLAIPLMFQHWSQAMINTVEPHLKWGSNEYLYGDVSDPAIAIPEEIPSHSRRHTARINSSGPIRTFPAPFRPLHYNDEGYESDHEFYDCMINGAPVMYSVNDVDKMADGPEKAAHLAAIQKECNGLVTKGVFVDGTPDKDATILRTITFGVKKMNGTLKYRVVADGSRQPEGTYADTSTPIVSEISLNIFLHVVAALDLELRHWDYEQAFLSAPIDQTNVWIRLPKLMGGGVKLLKRALYGLKQAGALFVSMVHDNLKEFGFKQCVKDPCVFVLHTDEPAMLFNEDLTLVTNYDHPEASRSIPIKDADDVLIGFQRTYPDGKPMNHMIMVAQYVDDNAVAFTRGNKKVDELAAFIRSKPNQVFTDEDFTAFLNFNFTRDRSARTITMNQRTHSDKLIQEVLGVTDAAKIKSPITPMPPGWMPEIKTQDDPRDDYMTEERVSEFRSQLMSLNYITRTIPQLKYPTGQLCRTMQNPTKSNQADLKRLVRWLAGNRDRGLVLGKGDLTCRALSDSDWAADRITRRSCSGTMVCVGDSLVLAKSKLQSLTAQSSMEAELIAMTECSKTVVYVRDLLNELGFPQREASILLVDNQSAIMMSRSQMQVYRNRHIPIRYFVCKDLIRQGIIDVQWVASADNTSDILTKCVTSELFLKHQDDISVVTV